MRDMFDGSDLYLVNVLGEVKTYKAESLMPLRKDTKVQQRINPIYNNSKLCTRKQRKQSLM